ncbi:CCAAT/enhancer-binding protein zeta [Fasciolopsis buskii]|uniref:CCAAT/enhancer-binding protein zeta n=1 Tax=Fasciolopsis buskii TaxID=27845 RepID=A0A8E0VN15_9TREM|nr:CCAAT/enhancer-binding protein zeta [Fasciolopsis buski]
MAYLISSHPTSCLRYLDSLISIINPAKQRDCFQSIDALYQLWDRSLLPKNRCLISLNCRPFGTVSTEEPERAQEILSLWFFEDELKSRYLRFIKALEVYWQLWCAGHLKTSRYDAFSPHELSKVILAAVVNKLGDRSKVLASCVIHKLRGIAGKNAALLDAVVEEVRSFLFRPNLLERAKYYAISLLSCLQLKSERQKGNAQSGTGNTAVKLVKLYTAFFHTAVKSEEVPERLVTALLAGLSRAAPFVPDARFTEYLKEVDDIFRLVHTTSFNVSLQALTVLLQLSSHRPEIRDRYYQALYRKLRDPDLLQTSRGPTVLHLLYRSMLEDPDGDRRAAFAQRLLQLCLIHPQPGFVVGSLILLSKDSLSNSLLNSDKLFTGTSIGDVSHQKNDDSANDDEDEHFSDAPDSDEGNEVMTSPTKQPASKLTSTWEHRRNANWRRSGSKIKETDGVGKTMQSTITITTYDPDAREPLFARAGGYPTWPLVLLCNHAHPSVSLLAQTLLTGSTISYTGNPFDDFSIQHFLDRFAYKKPKSSQSKGSKNDAHKQNPPPGRPFQRQVGVKTGSRAFPVNSALFRQMAENRVPADEQFFHKYFKFLEARFGQQAKKSRNEEDSDASSISDDEFDAYLPMDGIGGTPAKNEKAKNAKKTKANKKPEKSDTKMLSNDFDVDLDLEDDDDEMVDAGIDSGSEGEDDDDDDSEEEEEEEEEFISGKSKSRRFDSVFASADEVGQLYQVQETPRERKQRMWEEKRSETSSHRRSGHRGRGRGRNRHHAGGVVGGKSTRQNKFVKSDRGHFKSHRTGKRDSRKR